jgi:hypothetical protein
MNIIESIKEKLLPGKSNLYAKKIYINLLLNNAISRCAIASANRKVNPQQPSTWEFSGFSQNGEDGIIEFLISALNYSNKYFLEIGTGNGIENNTSYLGHIKKFSGLQVEGSDQFHADALMIKPWLVECMNSFVDETTVQAIYQKMLIKDPDVFSIDIDGNDYYITKLLLETGLQPKIIVVEYNSAYGPEQSKTIPYHKNFNMFATEFSYLYYGVSLQGWKNLLASYGYEFVTVDSNGVNAFFINTKEFAEGFINDIEKIEFKENQHQLRLFNTTHEGQFEKMKHLPFVNI